jgi:ribonuclease P protein subunit POP4
MRTRENLIAHELIGLRVQVVSGACLDYAGIAGRVVDETKNTLVLETEKGEATVPKKGSTFRFFLADEGIDVDGSLIAMRPEERPKRLMKLLKNG